MPEDPFAWPKRNRKLGRALDRNEVAAMLQMLPNSVQGLIRRSENMSTPFPEIGGRAMKPGTNRVVRFWWQRHIRDYAKARSIPYVEPERS
jgi:hypothetical protein